MSKADPSAASEQAGTGQTWFKVWEDAPKLENRQLTFPSTSMLPTLRIITAVFKKVVGTFFFFALFGLIGARFSPPPLRQPHGIKVSHIVKLNRAVP